MRKSLLLFFFAFQSLNAICQDSTGRIDEKFLKIVHHIYIPQAKEAGTGFLVTVPVKGGRIDYLVTNKHMIGKYTLINPFIPYDSIIVDFPSKSGERIVPITIKISNNGKLENTVHIHPNPKIDVAIINLSDIFNKRYDITLNACDSSYLLRLTDLKEIPLGFGSQVFAIGYPANIMISGSNEPIGKAGYIASSTSGKIKIDVTFQIAQKIIPSSVEGSFILVDGLIVPGNSGGPVINPKEVKVGLANGQLTYTKSEVPNLIIGIVSSGLGNTGLTVVYSSDNILDLMEKSLRENYPGLFPSSH